MKISYKLAILAVGALVLFSGCSVKHPKYVGPAKAVSYDSDKVEKGELVTVVAHFSQHSTWTAGADGAESVYFAFQVAAEDTLKKGKRYFSIYRPIAISDFEGKGLKSEEDFIQRCIKDSTPTIGAPFQTTRYSASYCGTTVVQDSYLEIVQYKEKPKHVTSYDAEKIIALIKKAKKYVNLSDQINYKSEKDFGIGWGVYGAQDYGKWFDTRRSDPREADKVIENK